MTLGNSSQPPLTRRQVRELALDQVPGSTEDAPQPMDLDDTPDVTTSFADIIKPDVVAESVPVSAFAPRGSDPAPVTKPVVSGKRQAPERTLTRRQLRALAPAETPASEETAAPESGGTGDTSDTGDTGDTGDTLGDDSTSTGALNPPVGHWSVDRGDDEHAQTTPDQPFDQFMSRGTGAGGSPTTTSALILPSLPLQGSVSGPLMATGEILITGSYDLPRSLGSTGHHPASFDSSDMDHSDSDDDGGYNSTVAPVSASRAVSTHTSTRGVMTPPQKSALPLFLPITAAALAVGVGALFVLVYVLKIF